MNIQIMHSITTRNHHLNQYWLPLHGFSHVRCATVISTMILNADIATLYGTGNSSELSSCLKHGINNWWIHYAYSNVRLTNELLDNVIHSQWKHFCQIFRWTTYLANFITLFALLKTFNFLNFYFFTWPLDIVYFQWLCIIYIVLHDF